MSVRPVRKHYCDETPDRTQMADLLLRGDSGFEDDEDDYDDRDNGFVVQNVRAVTSSPAIVPPLLPPLVPAPPSTTCELSTRSPPTNANGSLSENRTSSADVVPVRRFGSANSFRSSSLVARRSEVVVDSQERMIRESISYEEATGIALLLRNFTRRRNSFEVVATSSMPTASTSGAEALRVLLETSAEQCDARSSVDVGEAVAFPTVPAVGTVTPGASRHQALPVPVPIPFFSTEVPLGASPTQWSSGIHAAPRELDPPAAEGMLVVERNDCEEESLEGAAGVVVVPTVVELDIPLVPISLVELLPATTSTRDVPVTAGSPPVECPVAAGDVAVVPTIDTTQRPIDFPPPPAVPDALSPSPILTETPVPNALSPMEALAEEEALLTLHYHDMVVRQDVRYRHLQEGERMRETLASIPFQRPSSAETARDIWVKHAQYIAAFEQLERNDIVSDESKYADALSNFMEIEAKGLKRRYDAAPRRHSLEKGSETSLLNEHSEYAPPQHQRESGDTTLADRGGDVAWRDCTVIPAVTPPQRCPVEDDVDTDPEVETALQAVLQFAAMENSEVAARDEIELRQRWYFVKRVVEPWAALRSATTPRKTNQPFVRGTHGVGDEARNILRSSPSPPQRRPWKEEPLLVNDLTRHGLQLKRSATRGVPVKPSRVPEGKTPGSPSTWPSASSFELRWYRYESQLLRDESDERSELEVGWLTAWRQLHLASMLQSDVSPTPFRAPVRAPIRPAPTPQRVGGGGMPSAMNRWEASPSPMPSSSVVSSTPHRATLFPAVVNTGSYSTPDRPANSSTSASVPLMLKPESAPLSTFFHLAEYPLSQRSDVRLPLLERYRGAPRTPVDSRRTVPTAPSAASRLDTSQAALRIVQCEAAIRDEIVREREKQLVLWKNQREVLLCGRDAWQMGGRSLPSVPRMNRNGSIVVPMDAMEGNHIHSRGTSARMRLQSRTEEERKGPPSPPPLPATSRCGVNADGTREPCSDAGGVPQQKHNSSWLSLHCSPLPSGALAVSWGARTGKSMV